MVSIVVDENLEELVISGENLMFEEILREGNYEGNRRFSWLN